MKVLLETGNIREAVAKVSAVVDRKSSRPILAYILVQVKGSQLELTASDLEVSSKISLDAEVQEEGTFCVNAKNFSDILREMPDGQLTLDLDSSKNILNINCHDIHFSLLITSPEDFPQLVFSNQKNSFSLKAKKLLEIISKTSYAISTDETRLHLNGLFLQEFDSNLRAVATDGHRLSLIDTDVESLDIEMFKNGIIVPKKGITEIKRMAESFLESDLEISIDDSFIYISAGNTYLSVRLIAREFPKYQAVIPSKTSFTLQIERSALLNSVKRIKIMANEKSHGVKLSLGQKELTVAANHPSLGDAKEIIPISFDGEEMEIGFNGKFLIDSLSTFDDGEIILEINNEFSPIIVKSPKATHCLDIIMPLKL